jgi:molybdenum cofactor synthesis domain-containing protein
MTSPADAPETTPPEPGTGTVTACLVIIGNEVLSGRTQDANLNFLAKALNEVGVQLREARVIPDIAETIIATVNEVRAKFDYVFTTGGIGPTHDDITAESVARAFGVKLVLSEEAKRRMIARAPDRPMNEARLRMAHVPDGAILIDNTISAAPGFQMGNVFVLAGIPAVAQAMFEALKHRLRRGATVVARTVVCDLPEGAIAGELGAIQARWPALDIGSYPAWHPGGGGFRVSLVLRGADQDALGRAADEVAEMVRRLGGTPQLDPAP